MVGHQNETERHFQLRNLEKDMAEAGRKGPKIMSKTDVRRMRTENRVLIALLILILVAVGLFSSFS